MKSLLIKDFYNLRKSLLVIFIIDAIFYAIVFLPSSGPEAFTAASTMMFSAVALTSYTYDDESGWNTYALATPISRKDLVLSKFVVLILYTLIGLLIGMIESLVYVAFSGISFDLSFYLIACALFFSFSMFVGSVYIYLISRFGMNTSKLLVLGMYVVPVLLLDGLYYLLDEMGIRLTIEQIQMGALAIPILCLGFVLLMYHLSYRLVLRKDY